MFLLQSLATDQVPVHLGTADIEFSLASIFCWPSLLPSSLPGFQAFVMLKPLAHRAADIPFVHQAGVLYF